MEKQRRIIAEVNSTINEVIEYQQKMLEVMKGEPKFKSLLEIQKDSIKYLEALKELDVIEEEYDEYKN